MRRVKGPPPRRPRRGRVSTFLRRSGLWVGVPVLLAGGLYAAVQPSRSPLGQSALQYAADRMLDGTARLGLVVTDIKVEGRETTDRETILAALGAGPGTPILAMSPRRAKEQLETLPWVRSAVVERRLPDTLYVRLVERKPLALWQHGGKLELIDREGGVIPVTRLDRFAKLPLVVGEGAARHAAELLDMLATEPDLAARVSAAIRVGDRRWNLRIDNAIDVLLPADAPAGAWAQLARLERSSAILKRDVQTVDVRLPDRLVLRVTPEAPKEAPPAKKGRPRRRTHDDNGRSAAARQTRQKSGKDRRRWPGETAQAGDPAARQPDRRARYRHDQDLLLYRAGRGRRAARSRHRPSDLARRAQRRNRRPRSDRHLGPECRARRRGDGRRDDRAGRGEPVGRLFRLAHHQGRDRRHRARDHRCRYAAGARARLC